MPSKQNIHAMDTWNRESTDLIRLRVRKEERLNERTQLVIEQGKAKSHLAYILDAIQKALEADVIPTIEDGNKGD